MGAVTWLLSFQLMILTVFGLNTSDVTVNLTQGFLRGFSVTGVDIFLGVPYAAPPVGTGRWAPPRPYSWPEGTLDVSSVTNGNVSNDARQYLDATSPPPLCPQLIPNPWVGELNHTSEDCLYLNIYAPAVSITFIPVKIICFYTLWYM